MRTAYPITIANGATVSSAFNVSPDERIHSIKFPTMTGTNFTLELSDDEGVTWYTLSGPTIAKGSAGVSMAFTTDANYRGAQGVGMARIKSDGTEAAERSLVVYVTRYTGKF